jgi:hypothetical protein
MTTPPLRFLQASDLHLGGRAWPGGFALDPEAAAARRRELEAVPGRLAELARAEGAEVVLLPGDLFDRETTPPEVVNALAGALESLAPTPVFIAPGNHDAATAASPYAAAASLGVRPWPSNVTIFREPDFAVRPHPLRRDVSVTGHAFLTNTPATERRLAEPIPKGGTPITLLCLHGSLLESAPAAGKITLPFSREELLRQGFSYAALGHYHAAGTVLDAASAVRAAYGGRPFAAELGAPPGDASAGACLVGTVAPAGATIEKRVRLDERRAYALPVECGEVDTPGALREAALAALAAAGGGGADLVRFRLRGTHAPGWTPRLDLPPGSCFAWTAEQADLRPGYDLDALRAAADTEAASVESRFVRAVDERLAAATDPGERAALRDALACGLDALNGFLPEARDAD